MDERNWRELVYKTVVFVGAVGVVVLLVLIGYSAFTGAPDLNDIQQQLDLIEARLDQLE